MILHGNQRGGAKNLALHLLKDENEHVEAHELRGFVALDYACEVFSVSRWIGIRAKEVRSKLTNPDTLPGVDKARQQIAKDMAAHLGELQRHQDTAITLRITEIEEKRAH